MDDHNIKRSPQGTTKRRARGESPPQFLQGHQQRRGPGEKRPTEDMSCPESPVPVQSEELRWPRKDQSVPDKSSLGGQVHTPCATRRIQEQSRTSISLAQPDARQREASDISKTKPIRNKSWRSGNSKE
ncbi:hypothetical protein TNIN_421461 [Trichonephila inaurata madagascariensis]|uniref:Uncharacterized protein n=1 Tax=Trichonephila inaurata madagascariensis TaxID=2747483 RepID=A0A8X6XPZ2_9ARAC|nr:hypothetical protein TNIN_421461 [Trichonephila inaurata madagascariensis]